MAEFLEVIETIRSEEADVRRLFSSDDGSGVRTGRAAARRDSPEYLNDLAEAASLLADVYSGRRPMHYLEEAMTTSDFPQLFGDIIDRQLLAGYRETPTTFRSYLRVAQVSDFRTVKRFKIDGGEGVLSVVPEQTEYPEVGLSDGEYTYSVKKYGRRMPFSWETIVNDDLGALRDTPERFGRAARRTEERFATGLYVSSTGPNGTHFAVGNANIITGNPVLSIAALQTAMTVLAAQRDADGEPIFVDTVHLVVPPALRIVAENIVNALQIETVESGGTANQKLIAANWMKGKVQIHVAPYIPVIATTNGNTSWFLFADPSDGRPTAEVGFLRGHTEPEVFMKSPNAVRVGGVSAGALDGDFDTDTVEYKVRHVIGGSLMDPKVAVASNGSGS